MASRRFTVDSAKKKHFINILLFMPETGVNDAKDDKNIDDDDDEMKRTT